MPKRIPTQILDRAEARLANATTANGYTHTLILIERARLTPLRNTDLPIANIWLGPDVRVSGNYNLEERELSVMLELRDTTRDRPFVDVAEELASDAEIALNRAAAAPAVIDTPSIALGGLVTAFTLESATPAIGEGQAPICGVLLEFTARYKRAPDDPFTIVT